MVLDERTLPMDLQQDIQNWLNHQTKKMSYNCNERRAKCLKMLY